MFCKTCTPAKIGMKCVQQESVSEKRSFKKRRWYRVIVLIVFIQPITIFNPANLWGFDRSLVKTESQANMYKTKK